MCQWVTRSPIELSWTAKKNTTPGKISATADGDVRDKYHACRKVSDSICNTLTSITNQNRRLLCACSIWSIAFDRKKGDVSVWRRVKVVNANNFHWSLLHMNEEPDLSLTCLWSFWRFGYPCHIFLLLRVLLMRWDGFKYFWLACRSQIRQRISLSGNRKKGAHVTCNMRASHE